jgi:exocyst complex component 2
VNDSLEQLDIKLFDEFIKRKVRQISPIVKKGIASGATDSKGRASGLLCGYDGVIQPWVLEVLCSMAAAHAEVTEIADQLLDRTLKSLYSAMLKVVYEALASFEAIDETGLLQFTLDIEFLQRVMASFVTASSTDLVQEMFVHADNYRSPSFSTSRYSSEKKKLRGILEASLQATAKQFLCFQDPGNGRGPANG